MNVENEKGEVTTIDVTPDNPTGLTHVSLLEKKEGTVENDNEHTEWIEYWKDGILRHRSAAVVLKPLRMKQKQGSVT